MKKLQNSYWPAIFWSAIIFILLIIPGSDLPNNSALYKIPNLDKWIHFVLFAVFVILWCWIIRVKKPHANLLINFFLITLTGVVFGYVLELVQRDLVTNRDYDLLDIAADSTGAFVGFIFSIIFFRKKRNND